MSEPPRPAHAEPITRWYREPYAWMVFGLPAAVVLACAVTIVIAVRTADGLVVDDYYKRGLEINKVLVREEAARAQAIEADVAIEADGRFQVALRATEGFAFPARLDVLLAHATRAGGDRTVSVEHLGAGVYRGEAGPLRAGPWHVDVSTPQWRIVRRAWIATAR